MGRVAVVGRGEMLCGLGRKSNATKVRGAAGRIYVAEAETTSRCT